MAPPAPKVLFPPPATSWRDFAPPASGVPQVLQPIGSGNLLLGTSKGVFHYQHGNWEIAGLENDLVLTLAIDPGNSKHWLAGTTTGLFQTTDAGQTWQRIPIAGPQAFHAVAFDPTTPSLALAGAWVNGQNMPSLWTTSDGGDTWQSLGGSSDIDAITFSPDGRSLYVGTYGGGLVMTPVSLNHIGPWSKSDQGLPQNTDMTRLVFDGQNLVEGTHDYGIFIKKVGSDAWRNVPLPPNVADIHSLGVDPAQPGVLWVGDMDNATGVWATADYGRNWSDWSAGLPNHSFNQLWYDAQTRTLFALTMGGLEIRQVPTIP